MVWVSVPARGQGYAGREDGFCSVESRLNMNDEDSQETDEGILYTRSGGILYMNQNKDLLCIEEKGGLVGGGRALRICTSHVCTSSCAKEKRLLELLQIEFRW